MITLGKRVVVCSSAAFAFVLACSESSDPQPIPVGSSGSTARAGSTASGGAGATGGSSASGGAGGASGSGGSAGAAMCDPLCSDGKMCITGACGCPNYAPDHCASAAKCTDVQDDPEHCGACDMACGELAGCNGGECADDPIELYATTDCERLYLAVQGGNLYVVNSGAGTLHAIPVTPGAATELATGLTGATAIVTDADNAYVVTGMSLSRVPLSGGSPESVVTETAAIYDVTLSEGTLYYAVGTDVKSVAADANAGTGVVVATALDNGEPQSVAVDGDFVLWAANVAYNVEVDLIEGEGHVKIGASQGGLLFGPRGLATDGTYVYWANGSNLVRALFDSENLSQTTVGSSRATGNVTAFAVTGEAAYFAANGNLEKVVLGEQDATWLARNQGDVHSVIADAASVYWSTAACKVLSTAL